MSVQQERREADTSDADARLVRATTTAVLDPQADEAGTAPEDRQFRPDIQGLRAIAVLLVVLYHGGLGALSGGYVGVDVFFVISGFVITGVLLRERASLGHTSLLSFYGRRCRRIIPASTLVIVVVVIATYLVLGVVYGAPTAVDARWTAAFLANFHFAAAGSNYLSANMPPSPLLNFWSLAVEEQFYIVYPTVFLVVASLRTRWSLARRLTVALGAIIVVSFVLSVVQTASNPTAAYYSPLTRAWELALGALVAVATPRLLRLPATLGAAMTWAGLLAIGVGAVAFDTQSAYPGSLVALPVVGSALVIAGGAPAPRWGAESFLRHAPFQWFGKLSYSLYLWHWPLLVLAADSAGQASLPFRKNLVWLAVALAASVVTFRLIENPIRHWRSTAFRRSAPIVLGLALIALTLIVSTWQLNAHAAAPARQAPAADKKQGATDVASAFAAFLRNGMAPDEAAVTRAVRAAPAIKTLPHDATPSLAALPQAFGGPLAPCWPDFGQTSIPATCVSGDLQANRTVVLYGDSHAGMWFDAMSLAGNLYGWKLVDLGKGDCPANDLPYENPSGWGRSGALFTACKQWHQFAMQRIRSLHPDLVAITEEFRFRPGGAPYSPRAWRAGLARTIGELGVPKAHVAILGNMPILPHSPPGCLSRHPTEIQLCSAPLPEYLTEYLDAERKAASDAGSHYVNVIPWFCSDICTPVIGRYLPYWDKLHVALPYSMYLTKVLAQSLGMAPRAR